MSALWFGGAFFVAFGLFIETSGLAVPLAYLEKRNPEVCTSKECTEMNKNWLSKVDFTAQPCNDFYQFACGRYNDSKSEITIEESKMIQQLIKIFKTPPSSNDHRAVKMTKEMFRYCLNHNSNIKDLKRMAAQLGASALLDSKWKEKNFSLVEFYSRSMQIGYLPKSLFIIDVDMHPLNRQNIVIIRPGAQPNTLMEDIFQTSWSLDSAINEQEVRNYLDNVFIPKFASKMEVPEQNVKDQVYMYVTMRRKLEAINREPQNVMWSTLAEMKVFYNNIPWKELLKVVFTTAPVFENEYIQLDCPRCLHFLNNALYNMSWTFVGNYLITSFVIDMVMSADDDLMRDFLGINTALSKENYCADAIFSPFRRVVDYEYINRGYIDKSIIPLVQKFTEKLKTAMKNTLHDNILLDSITKQKAIHKVDKIVFKIAYDDVIDKGQQVLQYFDDLKLDPKYYLPSLLNTMKFMTKKVIGSLRKQAKLPYLEATKANAMYYPCYNTIFLSINMLRNTLYSKGNRPEYLNFGALGNVIAHEMNHAFDFKGHRFDEKGDLKNWWNEETKIKYHKVFECIVQQYSSFTNVETGNKVNAIQTLSENFADIGGMEVVYRAYHDLPKTKELLLQNFQYTLPQMFWIAFATSVCAKNTREVVLRNEKTSFHAEKRIRINGVAMNSEEFATDWQCKENSPMNPVEKCTVWK